MQKQNFNFDWQFYLEGIPLSRRWQPDESSWRTLDLPHDWSIELERHPDNPSGAEGGYFPNGRGWYRKAIFPPQEWRGKKVFIEFEGVYMNAEIRLNEHVIGRHPYGYTSFCYDLTPYLVFGAENVLKVMVDNACQPNSRWYSGAGIYRPVWLYVADLLHVAHWGVFVTTPRVSSEAASVHVQTRVENETDVSCDISLRSRVIAPDGTLVGDFRTAHLLTARGRLEAIHDLDITAPSLWSTTTPHLYRLETEVVSAGNIVDTTTTYFGIRHLQFSPAKGFLLNGEPLKLKGGCVHHDNGVLGAASYSRSEERKVELHKASGFNAIRCAHNPPAPSFLDACDRLGMLVIDEAFDCWREGKNPYDYHVVFDDWWRRDVESMLYRDRNHPCIIMWSIGNEVLERDGRSGGVEIARNLAERVSSLDPTRPITSAICGSWDGADWSHMAGVFSTLDVGGYNYQWRQYVPDHELHPQRIMVGTESFPLEALDNWNSVINHDYVIGDFVWTSLDYLGESGIGRVHFDKESAPFLGAYPWHQANCGDLDLCGFKRPQSYYRDIVWQNGTRLYLAVHYPLPTGLSPVITRWGWPDVYPCWNWPGMEGQSFIVDVYSACDKVELFLNGKSLGIKPTTKADKYLATFEVLYTPGELKAVGYASNQPVAECQLKTAGVPQRIRLAPDRQTISAEKGDLCFITVEIVDQDGLMHPSADHTIYFTVKGEGTIAAVGSSNPLSQESYRGNCRSAYRGRCLVVVKSSRQGGTIHLCAQADGLEGAEITI